MEQEQRLAYALVRTAKTYLRLSSAGLAELGLQQGQDRAAALRSGGKTVCPSLSSWRA